MTGNNFGEKFFHIFFLILPYYSGDGDEGSLGAKLR